MMPIMPIMQLRPPISSAGRRRREPSGMTNRAFRASTDAGVPLLAAQRTASAGRRPVKAWAEARREALAEAAVQREELSISKMG